MPGEMCKKYPISVALSPPPPCGRARGSAMSDDRRKETHRHRAATGFGEAASRWFAGFRRTAVGFRSDASGAVMILTAFMAIVLIGFAGLAVDAGSWYVTKRSMQSAADAAAINAAIEMTGTGVTNAQVIGAARQAAAQNGFDTEAGALVDAAVTANGQSVVVQISQSSPTQFASLFLGGSVTIQAAATASLNASPICIHSLEPTAAGGLVLDSNARINAAGCSIQVNSTDSTALEINSNASLSAESICVTGGYDVGSNGAVSPTPDTGSGACPPVSDPLAAIPAPSFSGCDYTDLEVDHASTTLNPGVYCGGLRIKSNSSVQFSAGEYIIKDQDLKVGSNSSVQGTGVGFYFTNGATFHFTSNTTVDLTAPTDGPLAGFVFFQDRSEGGTHSFDSNNATRLEGAIYLPNGKLELNSNSVIGADSAFTILIARFIEVNSNAELVLNSDYAASDVPMLLPIAASMVRLTN